MTARKIRLPGNPWIERWDVIGSRGDTWIVSKRQDGTYGCSCPAWRFARAPKPACKHVIATLADLGQSQTFQPMAKSAAPIQSPVIASNASFERFTVRRKIREE
jgi:hypothetical protein